MRFKQFLQEDKGLTLEEAVKVYKEHCTQWPDVYWPLHRSMESSIPASVQQTGPRTSRGGSGKISTWLSTLPSWKDVPLRSQSVFCSNVYEQDGFGDHHYIVYPFDNTKLAAIKEDFNFIDVHINKYYFEFAEMEFLVEQAYRVLFGGSELDFGFQYKTLKTWFDQRSDEKAIETWNEKNILYQATTIREIRRLRALIEADESYFDAETMGVQTFSNSSEISDLVENDHAQHEVWFSGKYLIIPFGQRDEFKRLVHP